MAAAKLDEECEVSLRQLNVNLGTLGYVFPRRAFLGKFEQC